MNQYRVQMIEKICYEIYVEAENEEQAEEKAIEAFENGDDALEVTDQCVFEIDVEKE